METRPIDYIVVKARRLNKLAKKVKILMESNISEDMHWRCAGGVQAVTVKVKSAEDGSVSEKDIFVQAMELWVDNEEQVPDEDLVDDEGDEALPSSL